jgi:predicted Zn finger-like uncharacterized protein
VKILCAHCGALSRLSDNKIPVGRSYVVCPNCASRINIFKSVAIGSIVRNLTNLRFLGGDNNFNDRFCEAGEMWRVVDVVEPCPDKGKGRSCEAQNRGRCPNQRMVVRLSRDSVLYKTCLYRNGRRIFDLGGRSPVGNCAVTSGSQSIETKGSS